MKHLKQKEDNPTCTAGKIATVVGVAFGILILGTISSAFISAAISTADNPAGVGLGMALFSIAAFGTAAVIYKSSSADREDAILKKERVNEV